MTKHVKSLALVGLGIFLSAFSSSAWSVIKAKAQTGNCQTFPQTGYSVCGRFLEYWRANGGLAQQGYPISNPFVETSELNGLPYTVQYFERAVFEHHPENRPPHDVLLSQLGAYQGERLYGQGFPTEQGRMPFYEDRTSSTGTLKSFYNAINRKEFGRAYDYFEGAPNPNPDLAPPIDRWTAGYSNTLSVTLAMGINNIFRGAAAGSIYESVPVAITAAHTGGSTHRFAGCYTLRRTNEGLSPDPTDELWRIYSASISEVPANSKVADLLNRNCRQ